MLKTVLYLLTLVLLCGLFSFSSHAEREKFNFNKPKLDPVCVTSDNLRFQIDEYKLAIPREYVEGFSFSDPEMEAIRKSHDREFCQRTDDNPLKVAQIHFQIGRASDNDKCDPRISVILRRTLKKPLESRKTLTERLAKDCMARKYFAYCRNDYDTSNYSVLMQYDYTCYPPEKIATTLKLVEKKLAEYHSNSD